MISFNGNTLEGISIEDSEYASMPVTGLDSAGHIIIIVDSHQLLSSPRWFMISILAHELGHITNRDVYLKDCVNKPNELKADYYAGFWAHRAQCPLVDSVIAPFLTVIPDEDHPEGAKRREWVIKGWNDEVKPFKLQAPANFGLNTLSDYYGQYIDILGTISPYRWTATSKNYGYKMKVLIGTKDYRLPTSRIVLLIQKVSYSIDDKYFRISFPYFSSRSNDFAYMSFGQRRRLPITCTIYFVDRSIKTITKTFDFN